VLLDQSGTLKAELKRGEHKSLQTDRVVLRPGPNEEIEIVQRIYRGFLEESLNEGEIARQLNADGLRTDLGRLWTSGTVHQILTNEKYIGNNVYNRKSFKLKQHRVANPPEAWVRKPGAFTPVVPVEWFYTAQGIIQARSRRQSDTELLDRLKQLYQERGFLSGILIDETEGMASSSVYASRFGGLVRAYALIGFSPDRDYAFLEVNKLLRRMHPELVQQVESEILALGATIERDSATDLLRINDEFSASLILARCNINDAGRQRWKLRLDTSLRPDVTIAVRLNQDNAAPLDYYLLPWIDLGPSRLTLGEVNASLLDGYRFDNLSMLYNMSQRASIRRAA
jgi:hypothetical protein